MRRSFALLFACSLIPSVVVADWVSHGPFGGRAEAVVAVPSDSRVLYTGSAGGIFRSSDGGATWTNVSGSLLEVRHIAVNPMNSDIVYISSSGDLYKTTDGGAIWGRLGGVPEDLRPTAIIIDPRSPETVYVGSMCGPFFKGESAFHEGSGVYKSTDGGITWWNTMADIAAIDRCVRSLAIDPAAPDTLYGNSDGYLRTDNAGLTWFRTQEPLPSRAVVVDPRNSNMRYGIASTLGRPFLFVSSDAGGTWSLITPVVIATAGLLGIPTALAIDTVSGRLFLGTETGLYRSGDRGSTWLPLEGSAREPITAVVYNSRADELTIGTPSGVYRSASFPWAEWIQLKVGDLAVEVSDMTAHPTELGTIYAAAIRHVYRTNDFGKSWELAAEPLPITDVERPFIRDVAMTINGDLWIVAYLGPSGDFGPNGDFLYKLPSGSREWMRFGPTLVGTNTMAFVTADPKRPNTVYQAHLEGIARTTDGGGTWELLRFPIRAFPQVLGIDPTDSDVLYAGTEQGLLKSTDGGRTWILKAAGRYSSVLALAISTADATTLYMYARRVNLDFVIARSNDGGESWSDFPISDHVSSIALDRRNPLTLYIATSNNGVLRSRNGGESWEPVGGGLPQRAVTDLAIDLAGASLHAGVFGRSVWEHRIATRGRAVRPH